MIWSGAILNYAIPLVPFVNGATSSILEDDWSGADVEP